VSDRAHILVVDDDRAIVRALQSVLDVAGYASQSASTGAAALEAAALRPPDLILLDMILPDIDGVAVCGRLREWTERPIIMLSALDGDALKIAALDAGADDYLRKPFSTGELLARVRAVMRRSARVDDGGALVAFGDIEMNLSARSVRRGGELVHLTPREYSLLAELARHAGRLVTHAALLEAVWGPRATRETQYLRVYIAGLRRKLERDPSAPRHLLTEPGIGYRLEADSLVPALIAGA
jgi:two-component system, OmpR family, KDP operon response regulator KdpE